MATTGTSGERWTSVAKGLAVGVGILVGSLAGPDEGRAQMPGASRGMPAPSGSIQPGGQVTVPGYRGSAATPDVQHEGFRRHGGRDWRRDHDRDGRWDHGHGGRPHWGWSGPYYPRYDYYYPPYGTYPGRWVWDGWNWIFVPIYYR